MNRSYSIFLLMMVFLSLPGLVYAASGGGYTACGLDGEYFSNPKFDGAPAFSRQDNRLSFDWGTRFPVGGSNTPSYRTFPHDNFSVRWTGKAVPRFSEKYTFIADMEGSVRVWLNNDLIIDRWAGGSSPNTVSGSEEASIASNAISLEAGTPYDLRVEYRHYTGAAKLVLKWLSPSTPEEVIDPLSVNGFNLANCTSVLFADEVKYCLVEEFNHEVCWFRANDGKSDDIAFVPGLPASDLDSNFWPKKDFIIWLNPYTLAPTTYKIQFSGQADVYGRRRWANSLMTFVVGDKEYSPTLPAGVGYDPKTNTTTALMRAPATGAASTYALMFSNTKRNANAPLHSGITNLHVMRAASLAEDAQPCEVGTIAYPPAKSVLRNYVVWRCFDDAFADERTWSERTLPGMPSVAGSPPIRTSGPWYNKPCWEYMIMLANETGKDLYFSVSATADHDYYVKLANLIKYGSDGANPYTSTSQWPSTGPVYPPLNSNLRFYIEYSNEVWNWGFGQFGMAKAACGEAVANKTPDGLIVNYDGQGDGSYSRWQALQTVNISNAFRSVFGDAAMGNRIRVLLFDQYGMYGNTMGQFLDNYFNKSDPKSTYAGAPHPVSYYIWGGGGAIYYSSNHSSGIDDDIQIPNGSFEMPELALGSSQVNPQGSGWTFAGNAGICRNIARTQAINLAVLGTPAAPAQREWIGFKFTVGAKPIYVYDVARMVAPDDVHTHSVNIFKGDGTGLLANQIASDGAAAGKYAWMRISEQGFTRNLMVPLKLDANTTYYIMSQEDEGDPCYTQATQAAGTVSPAGITIDCGVTSADSFKPVEGSATSIGPVDFTFTDTPLGDLGFTCDAADGVQSAFIGDTGSMTQTVDFPKTGVYAIGFNAGDKPNAGNPIDIYIDGTKCTPSSGDMNVSPTPWLPGGFDRRDDDLALWWGSAPFSITTPGKHEIQIEGTGKAGQYIFLDNMKILSVDSIYGPDCSHFPSMGEANGQDPRGGLDNYVNTLHNEINWTAAWGLKTTAYEGGWSLGGDFDQKPIHLYCKYVSPRTIDADDKAINTYISGGGSLFCYFYNQWLPEDTDNALKYPLVQAVVKRNDLLPAEANYGALVPGNITPMTSSLLSDSADRTGLIPARGAWINWDVIAPVTQTYRLTGTVAGTEGSYVLLVDDAIVVASGIVGKDATGTVKLTKGQHTVKIRNTGSSPLSVKNIAISMDGSPVAPSITKYDLSGGKCALTWSAVPSATSYNVFYGTVPGNFTDLIKVGNKTSVTISGLDDSNVYYVSIQAANAANLLSTCSDETRIATRSTDRQVLINFDDQPLTSSQIDLTKPSDLMIGDYQFTAVKVGTDEKSVLKIEGPPYWPSHVLTTAFWGVGPRIQRVDGKPFDLYSLDLIWSEPISAEITGYDPSGASFNKVVNITPVNGKPEVVPVTLDWAHVERVDIQWRQKLDGGGDGRRGCINSILINKTEQK